MSNCFEAAGSQSGKVAQSDWETLTFTERLLVQRYRALSEGKRGYFDQAIEAVEAMERLQQRV